MESTETMPRPAANGRQGKQLIASRYRLASFHRGDDSTEIWRALDESANQVVTLEFLRDPDPLGKERFLAGARRLASVKVPSVMKVAAIHDDADGTFIVFEHLVHVPVPIEWLTPAVEPPAALPTTPVPTAIEAPSVEPAATPPATPTTNVADAAAGDHGLSLLLFALRSRELSLIDVPLLKESAIEFAGVVVSEFKQVRLDPNLSTDARAFVESILTSAPTRAARAVGRLTAIRPRVRVPAPHLSRPKPVRAPRVKAVAPTKPAALRAPRVSRGLGVRVRWGRVLSRGLSLGLLAVVLIALPSELIGNVANLANELSSAVRDRLAAATSSPALQRASFELPPLTAYGAAFESQAPYPTAHPNGTVEWVVALRNTGSVGWYRGIDGAQASLALADGTTAGVQTTAYVGPGQVGWFVVHFAAPSQPGPSKVLLRPRIDGRGPLPDLGIYATVTVSPNP